MTPTVRYDADEKDKTVLAGTAVNKSKTFFSG